MAMLLLQRSIIAVVYPFKVVDKIIVEICFSCPDIRAADNKLLITKHIGKKVFWDFKLFEEGPDFRPKAIPDVNQVQKSGFLKIPARLAEPLVDMGPVACFGVAQPLLIPEKQFLQKSAVSMGDIRKQEIIKIVVLDPLLGVQIQRKTPEKSHVVKGLQDNGKHIGFYPVVCIHIRRADDNFEILLNAVGIGDMVHAMERDFCSLNSELLLVVFVAQ